MSQEKHRRRIRQRRGSVEPGLDPTFTPTTARVSLEQQAEAASRGARQPQEPEPFHGIEDLVQEPVAEAAISPATGEPIPPAIVTQAPAPTPEMPPHPPLLAPEVTLSRPMPARPVDDNRPSHPPGDV